VTARPKKSGPPLRPLLPDWRSLNQTMAVEGEIPHLDNPRVPLHADFRRVLQLRYELAQDVRVRSPIEQEEPLIIEDPRPAPLRNQPIAVDQERIGRPPALLGAGLVGLMAVRRRPQGTKGERAKERAGVTDTPPVLQFMERASPGIKRGKEVLDPSAAVSTVWHSVHRIIHEICRANGCRTGC
jgi:hypothetical protein